MASSTWKVASHLYGGKLSDIGRYAVVILNRPINIHQKHIINVWDEAYFRASTDGGVDRWFDFLLTLGKDSQPKQVYPDLVTGDFDSIRPETLQRCKNSGVNVVSSPDQDETDFTKIIKEIVKQKKGEIETIIAIGENSGRLDHIMSNLNTLYKTEDLFGSLSIQLYLMSTESMTWLLPTGSHTIHIPQKLVLSQETCGLIPLGSPCVVTTTGFKWNLDNDKMEFGALVSSSNTYDETNRDGVVTVKTDAPLLWTMTIRFNKY